MHRISLVLQEGVLKSYFPTSKIKRKGESELIWTHSISPTPLSNSYKIKLHYLRYNGVNVYVTEPKLALAPGKDKLPHVYSTPEQRLCLYYPDGIEWNVGKLYVKTLIPWASEWLYHYEIWLGTGVWHGGGIGHETEAEKQEQKQKEDIIDEGTKDKRTRF